MRTSSVLIVTSWLLRKGESFQPGFVLDRQQHPTVWGLQTDQRLSFPLHSTTSPSSAKAETDQDDNNGDEKENVEKNIHLESMKEEEPLQRQSEQASNNKESEEPMIISSDSATNNEQEEKLSMPWSTVQEWALRDYLPKYTVMIPLNKNDPNYKKETTNVYALWRTMLKEVPELTGYPMDFLEERHAKQIESSVTLMEVTPALLPYLDDYEFAAAGGIAGNIYGVPGLADGTRIETSSVTNIEVTLPKGFIRTSDGSAAYELGRPNTREEFRSSTIAASSLNAAMKSGSYELLKTVQSNAASQGEIMEDADGMLVRLGASTAILLAGATAVSMLSHHMTVNVFWV
jgi:hypothetical protein